MSQRLLKCCQSGKISQILVTLIGTEVKPHFSKDKLEAKEKAKPSKQEQSLQPHGSWLVVGRGLNGSSSDVGM